MRLKFLKLQSRKIFIEHMGKLKNILILKTNATKIWEDVLYSNNILI